MRYPMIAAALLLATGPAFAQVATTAQSAAPGAGQLPNTPNTDARSPAAQAQATVAGSANQPEPANLPDPAKQQQMAHQNQMDDMRGVDHGPGSNSGAVGMSTPPAL